MFPLEGPSPSEPAQPAGDAADAIRRAETALARQNSLTASVDLQVVTAVLNARAAHAAGEQSLRALQQEIEAAIATRTDLDTPAGAREFQRYLIDKLHDIRGVVEETDLDDTSKAALAAALASLYATSGSPEPGPVSAALPPAPPPGAEPAPPHRPEATPLGAPVDLGLDSGHSSGLGSGFGDDLGDGLDPGLPAEPPPVQAPAAAPPAAMPSFGGGSAPAMPSLGGLSPLAPLSTLPNLAGLAAARAAGEPDSPGESDPPPDDATDPAEHQRPASDVAPDRPELAAVIAAAVAGTPIADAFGQQGITIPGPGSPVAAPLDSGELVAGDVGVFTDRHALSLGNGRALLDNQIQPIEAVNRPGFLGWQHPPAPLSPTPESPAPETETRPPEPPAPAPPVAPAD